MPPSTFGKKYSSLKFDTLFDPYRNMRKSEDLKSIERQVDLIRDVISTAFPDHLIDSFRKFKKYSTSSEIVEKILASQNIAEEAKAIFHVCAEHPECTIAEKARQIGISRPIFRKRYKELKFDTLFDPYIKIQKSDALNHLEKQSKIIKDIISKAIPNQAIDPFSNFSTYSITPEIMKEVLASQDLEKITKAIFHVCAEHPEFTATKKAHTINMPPSTFSKKYIALKFDILFDSYKENQKSEKLKDIEKQTEIIRDVVSKAFPNQAINPFSNFSKYSITPEIMKEVLASQDLEKTTKAIFQVCAEYPKLSIADKAHTINIPSSTFSKRYIALKFDTFFYTSKEMRKSTKLKSKRG
jgi:hypothetical protein